MLFCKVHVQTRASNNFAILPLFHYCWSWSIRWTILVLLRALTGPVLFSLTCASYLFAALVCVNISACCSRCCTSAYIAIVLCRCPLVILRRDWSEIHLGWLERVSSLPDISCFFFFGFVTWAPCSLVMLLQFSCGPVDSRPVRGWNAFNHYQFWLPGLLLMLCSVLAGKTVIRSLSSATPSPPKASPKGCLSDSCNETWTCSAVFDRRQCRVSPFGSCRFKFHYSMTPYRCI